MSQSTTATNHTSTQNLAQHAGLLESMPKQFFPVEHENRISVRWEKARAFRADPAAVLRGERKPFSMFIPPPNVTGALHLGHALNNTLQDVLTRYHRMAGYETLWMPGTDHAGIATQAVVEKRLRKDGELKGPLKDADRNGGWTREKFVTKVQEWKDEYEARITNQLKAMGASCDFSRQRFTMDPVCAAAVREAFFRLFSDGLIDRGKRLVNWDPALQTAVADDECYDEEINGNFYYLRYPLVHASSQDPAIRTGGRENVDPLPLTWGELARRGYPGADQFDSDVQAWVTVATTRPETYLGDTAVAVNPHDPRAKALRGVFIELPVVGRIIPIIEDEYVVLPREVAERLGRDEDAKDPKSAFASGFLKVTPAHDQNDWELGLRHHLEKINVMAPDGSISSAHGWSDVGNATIFVGKKREDARKSVVKYFEEHSIQGSTYKLLEQIKPYRHSVKHSDRSKAIVEPYLSDQWYVKVTDPRLAKAANETLVKAEAPAFGGTALQSRALDRDVLNLPLKFPLRPAGFVDRNPFPPGEAVPQDFSSYRRNLPHISLDGATYFVTWRCRDEYTMDGADRSTVLDALRHFDGDRVQLYAACVMNNHVHCIVRPIGGNTLHEWLESVKKFSARQINERSARQGSLWLDENFDHIIRDAGWFAEALQYILYNPVKAGLVHNPCDYPHTWISLETAGEIVRSLTEPGRERLLSEAERKLVMRLHEQRTALESRATKGTAHDTTHLTFHPERYAKTFQQWHEGIRDWCISRQLWWGHRIPVWSAPLAFDFGKEKLKGMLETLDGWKASGRIAYCQRALIKENLILAQTQTAPTSGTARNLVDEADAGETDFKWNFVCVRASEDNEVISFLETHGFTQDPDVLDTWFSSALWPLSTLGWPDPAAAEKMLPESQFTGLLAAFNPSTVLSTAREIITLWVSRMVMMNRYMLPPRASGDYAATWRKVIDFNRDKLVDVNGKPFGPDPNAGPSFSDMLMDCVDGMSVEVTRLSDGQRVDPAQLIPARPLTKELYEFRIQVQSPEFVKKWQLIEAGFEPDLAHAGGKAGTGPVPFRNVFVHAVVQDGEGKKMSKSAGNGVDPLDIIASHGADAMRFTLCQMSTQTQDVRMPVQVDPKTGKNTSPKFDLGRSFASKLWNACRFALTMLEGSASTQGDSTPIDPASLSLVDRWMLSRLQRGIASCERAFHAYEFNAYAEACYDLLWRDFCDFYLEAIKPTVAHSAEQRAVLRTALETIVRLLHPMMPYVTEAAYEKLVALPSRAIKGLTLSPGRAAQVSDGSTPLLCVSAWPEAKNLIDEASENAVQRLRELATTINQVRATYNVPPKARVTLFASENVRTLLTHAPKVVETLSGLNAVEPQGEQMPQGPGTAKVLFEGHELRLSGLPQVEASEGGTSEKDRLSKERAEISKKIAVLEGRLSNPGYIGRAPAKLVEETKSQLLSAQNELKVIDEALKALG